MAITPLHRLDEAVPSNSTDIRQNGEGGDTPERDADLSAFAAAYAKAVADSTLNAGIVPLHSLQRQAGPLKAGDTHHSREHPTPGSAARVGDATASDRPESVSSASIRPFVPE